MWLVLFMPWAMIGAFGCARPELLPHRRIARREILAFNTMLERNIQFLEQPADARDAPVDPILAKSLVHEVRVAGRQIRPEDRALAEPELLDEQCEADGDLSAARPGGDVDRLTRKAGDGVDSVLRHGRGG